MPRQPILTLDLITDDERRAYFEVKSPSGEIVRYYAIDGEDLGLAELARFRRLEKRLRALGADQIEDTDQLLDLSEQELAELEASIEEFFCLVWPDVPPEVVRRLGSVRQMLALQGFFAHLGINQPEAGVEMTPASPSPSKPSTGARSSRG